jgi:CRP/FNR family transcriptional regulator
MNDVLPSLRDVKLACRNCSLSQLCLPVAVKESEIELLDRLVRRRRPMSPGESIFRRGETFRNFYVVRSGSVKSYTVLEDGSGRVTGFHLPGELVGLDGIANGRHLCAAVTLETTSLCEISFENFEQFWKRAPGLPRQMLRVMSGALNNDQILLVQLGRKSAEERLAAFLLGLSVRMGRRGFSSRQFRLSMSRADIGSHLGLAEETISRLFTRFAELEILQVYRKNIHISSLERLRELACCTAQHAGGD